MIHAFKQIRLTNTLLSGSGSALVFGGTPLVFKNETGQFVDSSKTGGFVSISQTGQFVDSSKTGQFITTALTGSNPELLLVVTGQVLSGNWNITGISGANVYTSGTSIVVSTYNITSATGQFITTANTGAFLARGETGLFYPASNPNNYITAAQAGGVSAITVTGASISGNVNFTGIGGLNVSLSGTYVLISGGSVTNTGTLVGKGETGVFVTIYQTGGFVSISQTGQFITTANTGNFITTTMTGLLGIWTGNQQSFATVLYTGIDFTGISFPSVFATTPRTVLATMEVTGDIMYMVNVRNRNVSGYTAIFSDTIQESGVIVHTFVSL